MVPDVGGKALPGIAEILERLDGGDDQTGRPVGELADGGHPGSAEGSDETGYDGEKGEYGDQFVAHLTEHAATSGISVPSYRLEGGKMKCLVSTQIFH
ncbi:MAG: hypothetical protein Fur0034_18740 [Desulfuromonadia bacterium]